MGTFARHGFINRVTEMVNRLYYLCCNLALKSSLWQIFSCEPPTPSPTRPHPAHPKKKQNSQKILCKTASKPRQCKGSPKLQQFCSRHKKQTKRQPKFSTAIFQNKFTLWHIKISIYIQKTKFTSRKQYSSILQIFLSQKRQFTKFQKKDLQKTLAPVYMLLV